MCFVKDDYYNKLLFLFIVGFIVMMIYNYQTTTKHSFPIFYLLWPLTILLLAMNHSHNITYIYLHHKTTKYIFIILMIISISIFLITNDEYYSHIVYRNSIYIIWTILIVYLLICKKSVEELAIIKIIMFTGLILFFIFYPWEKNNYLYD